MTASIFPLNFHLSYSPDVEAEGSQSKLPQLANSYLQFVRHADE